MSLKKKIQAINNIEVGNSIVPCSLLQRWETISSRFSPPASLKAMKPAVVITLHTISRSFSLLYAIIIEYALARYQIFYDLIPSSLPQTDDQRLIWIEEQITYNETSVIMSASHVFITHR